MKVLEPPRALLQRAARHTLPAAARVRIRRWIADLPFRRRDFVADLRERFRPAGGGALPPPRLRHRVGPNSSREEFLHIGAVCAKDILRAYEQLPRDRSGDSRWLDFGCGCGRVARHLIGTPPIASYCGADVDRPQVAWAEENLGGRFVTIAPVPPTPFESEAFDVIFTISVFTHLDREAEAGWLDELRRLLRPGGLLIATTHAPAIAFATPGIPADEIDRLRRGGFLFRASPGPFNEQAAFHSGGYLADVWGRRFELRGLLPAALGGFQDISLWERPAG